METSLLAMATRSANLIFPLSRKLIEWKRARTRRWLRQRLFFPLSRKLIEWKRLDPPARPRETQLSS